MSEKMNIVIFLIKKSPSVPLRYIELEEMKPASWKYKMTYFKSEEVLTILACMNISPKDDF